MHDVVDVDVVQLVCSGNDLVVEVLSLLLVVVKGLVFAMDLQGGSDFEASYCLLPVGVEGVLDVLLRVIAVGVGT